MKKTVLISLLLCLLFAFSLAVRGAIPAGERSALIALYDSTNGDYWTDNSGWKTPPLHADGFAMPGTEGTWFGITVSGDHVTEILIGSNNMSGSLPAEIGNLPGLERLVLQQGHIAGGIPAAIGNLSSLTLLNLSQNDLSGGIPAAIGSLTNLVTLYLHYNDLVGGIPAAIGSLTHLVSFNLHANRLDGGIPAEIGNLTELRVFSLMYNRMRYEIPVSMTSLASLTDLSIGYNALHASDSGLIAFLNTKQPSWADTQTIAPANVVATTVNSSTINLSWDAIPYTAQTGGYRIFVGTAPGGPYAFFQQTADKTVTTLPVTGLAPNTPYYFVIQTRTDPHGSQQKNTVDSENSEEANATTIPAYTVTFQTDGTPGATLSGDTSQTVDYGGDSTAVTANSPPGYHLLNWTGTDDFVSTDNPLAMTNVRSDLLLTANFSIDAHEISGTVTVDGSPLANVVMDGLPGDPKTDASGFYTATVEHGWSGTVTPERTGYTFTPISRSYGGVDGDQDDQDYGAVLTSWIVVTAPNGGESWPKGSSQRITWDCAGVSGNARLVLFRGAAKLGVIATVPVTRKCYKWTAGSYIGGTAVAAKNYRIKVVTVDGVFSDWSDADFALNLDPYVRVVTPNGGESWALGSVRPISWISRGVAGNVRLVLFNGSDKENNIAVLDVSQKSYNWTVGEYIGGTAPAGDKYKVKVISADGNYLDLSDDKFEITDAAGGLLAYFRLDGDGSDASGNGLNATMQGFVPEATDRFGYVDGSLAFDTENARVEVELRENEPLIGEAGFAVCGWVKLGSPGKAQGIWSVMDGSEWLALERNADGRLCLRPSGISGELKAAEPLAGGRWAFVAVTFDAGTNVSRLRVDGELAAETAQLPIGTRWGRMVKLARAPAAGCLGGALDDFRLYDRPLSDGEIERLLNEKREGDLLVYYPLDGDVLDHSGNERHGSSDGASASADRWGRAAAALRGEGLRLPALAAADMAGGFTMNAWLRPGWTNRWQALFGEAGSGLVLRLTPENELELELAGKRRELAALRADAWSMVTLACRHDDGAVEAYLDGRLVGKVALPAEGGWLSGASLLAEFAGAADDVRLYRRALTLEEIGRHLRERD